MRRRCCGASWSAGSVRCRTGRGIALPPPTARRWRNGACACSTPAASTTSWRSAATPGQSRPTGGRGHGDGQNQAGRQFLAIPDEKSGKTLNLLQFSSPGRDNAALSRLAEFEGGNVCGMVSVPWSDSANAGTCRSGLCPRIMRLDGDKRRASEYARNRASVSRQSPFNAAALAKFCWKCLA